MPDGSVPDSSAPDGSASDGSARSPSPAGDRYGSTVTTTAPPSAAPTRERPAAGGRRATLGWSAVLTLGLAALAAVAVWRLDGFVADDAFITYRYARNLAAGEGWTYNPGERTANAATSPLSTVVLSGVASVAGPEQLPGAGRVLAVLALSATGLAVAGALRQLGAALAGVLGGVLVVTNPWLVSTVGMETALAAALGAGAVWAATARRQVTCGLLLGLAVLARPDSVLLAAPLLFWLWWRADFGTDVATRTGGVRGRGTREARRVPWAGIASMATVVLAWVPVALALGAEVLPATLAAKRAQTRSGLWGDGPLFLRGLVELPGWLGFGPWAVVAAAAAVVGVVGLRSRPLRGLTGVLCTFVGLHLAAYGLVLQPPAYHWYYGPELWVGSVTGGIALAALAGVVGHRRSGVVAAVAATVVIAGLGLASVPGGYRYHHYDEVADWLAANTAPGATVAAAEVGVLGWRSGRPVVDHLGLLDPRAVAELDAGDLSSWLERRRPDYWVVHEPLWPHEAPAAATPYFRESYEPVLRTDGLTIYRRRP